MVSRRHRRELDSLMERDRIPIATSVRPSTVLPTGVGLSLLVRSLEDRREYNPFGVYRPAASVFKADRDVVADRGSSVDKRVLRFGKFSQYGQRMSFRVPTRVSICVRRGVRRSVLFALKRTGKGARSRKRFNYWSAVRC